MSNPRPYLLPFPATCQNSSWPWTITDPGTAPSSSSHPMPAGRQSTRNCSTWQTRIATPQSCWTIESAWRPVTSLPLWTRLNREFRCWRRWRRTASPFASSPFFLWRGKDVLQSNRSYWFLLCTHKLKTICVFENVLMANYMLIIVRKKPVLVCFNLFVQFFQRSRSSVHHPRVVGLKRVRQRGRGQRHPRRPLLLQRKLSRFLEDWMQKGFGKGRPSSRKPAHISRPGLTYVDIICSCVSHIQVQNTRIERKWRLRRENKIIIE